MNNDILSKVIEGAKIGKKNKEALFDIKKEFATKKIELLKKQHSEKKDLHIAAMEEVQKNGYNPDLIKKCAEKQVALCEKHLQEWADLCKQKDEKFKSWAEKAKQDLANFKKGL